MPKKSRQLGVSKAAKQTAPEGDGRVIHARRHRPRRCPVLEGSGKGETQQDAPEVDEICSAADLDGGYEHRKGGQQNRHPENGCDGIKKGAGRRSKRRPSAVPCTADDADS